MLSRTRTAADTQTATGSRIVRRAAKLIVPAVVLATGSIAGATTAAADELTYEEQLAAYEVEYAQWEKDAAAAAAATGAWLANYNAALAVAAGWQKADGWVKSDSEVLNEDGSKTWTAWFASHIAPSDHTYVQHLLTTYKPDSDDAARTPLKITEGSVGDIVTVDGVNWTLVSGGKDYLSAKNGLDDYNNGICLLSSPSKATGTEKSATCTQGKLSQSISSWLGTKGFMFVPFTGSPNPAPSATMNAKWWPTVGSVVTLRVKASEYNTGEVKGAEWLYIDVTRVAGGSDANPMLNWLKYTQSTSESVYFFAATYTWEETLTIPAAPPAAPPAPQPPIEVGGGQPIPGEEEGEETLDPGDVGSTVPVDETGNTVVIEKTTIVNNTVTKEIPALAITGGPAPKLALTGEAPKLALTGIDGSVVFAAIMLLGTGCALVASTRREQEVTA